MAGRLSLLGAGRQKPIPWWLAGGIPSSACVVAYQAKGAASLAASYVNLANPGTYNLLVLSAPSWNATDGWIFDGTTGLNTGINASGKIDWSFSLRYSNASQVASGDGLIFGAKDAYAWFGYAASYAGTLYRRYYYGWGASIIENWKVSGIAGLAGSQRYFDGVNLQITGNNGDARAGGEIYVGKGSGIDSKPAASYIQALSIYNIKLSDSQMSALNTAMSAL